MDDWDDRNYGLGPPEENYDWLLIGAAIGVMLIAIFLAARCSV